MRKNFLKFLVAVCCLSMLFSAPVLHAGELVSAEDPDAILSVAKGFGSAVMKKDSGGDPLIICRVDGTKFGIYFFGCDSNGKKCDDIKFGTAWSGIKVPWETINEWNRSKRYGTAYLDNDGDPNLDMPVNIDHGVTRENLEDTFQFWTQILRIFKKEVLKQ